MSNLHKAAECALATLENPWKAGAEGVANAIFALRAALQEPVEEHERWCASVTQLLLCDPPRKAPCNCKKKQVEPVQEPVAWESSKDGKTIQDNDFTHDVVLRVTGDFEDDEQRISYANRIVNKLNAAALAEPVADELSGCVKTFFEDYLNIREESESGRIFAPIQISCCRAHKLEALGALLERMRVLSGAEPVVEYEES